MKGTGFLDMMEEPPSPLPGWLTQEDIDFYAEGYAKNGFFGPVSWYRNFDRNYETAKDLDPKVMTMPSYFIGGERDGVIGVACPSAVVAQELDLLSERVVERINEHLGRPLVKGLRPQPRPPRS